MWLMVRVWVKRCMVVCVEGSIGCAIEYGGVVRIVVGVVGKM